MIPVLATAMLSLTHATFAVKQFDDGWWLVDPSGRRFQSVGVCCVNRGLPPGKLDETNPGYSSGHYYRTDAAWAKDVAARLRRWGFDTIGAWSDHDLFAESGLFQTPVLHLSASGIPWVDMWDRAVVDATRGIAKKQIDGWKKLPGIVGYFSDNELGWWIGAHFEWAWKMKDGSPGRAKVLELTRRLYPTWDDLLRDFVPAGAGSYDELAHGGRLFLKPGGDGIRLVKAWVGVVAERYYSLCRDIVHEQSPGALFLGDRFISGFYPEVAAEAGKFCDVVSTNLNADWPQGEFAPYYLDGLWSATHRPILVTEYYATSMENRSGNMNDASGFPTLPTQKARAESAKRQTLAILSKPYVVGAHWFQYYDEPTHGREDGENYDMGLVDIDNRPYSSLTKSFSRPMERRSTREKSNDIPYVSATDGPNLASWPHADSVRIRTGGDPRGDLFLAWNGSGLYVAAYWKESRFAEALYSDGHIPEQDRAVLRVRIPGIDPVVAKIGEHDAEVSGARMLKLETGVNNTLVLRLPANLFGVKAFVSGRALSIDAELATQSRAYVMRWVGQSVTQGAAK